MTKDKKLLSSFQLITRYCKIEAPYWRYFLEHYKSLGISLFHICVQTEDDLDDFNNQFKGLCTNHIIHKLNSNLTPDVAMKNFNFKLINPDLKYTIFLDSDEFFNFTGNINDLNECIDKFTQIRIPWVMNILENIYDDKCQGYYGHTGKPISLTSQITSLHGDHAFKLRGFRKKVEHLIGKRSEHRIPLLINAILIHYWSRGIKDVILRTIFSRFKSFKQSDQSQFFEIIKSGSLPNRLKMMAFLSIQKNYLFFESKFISNYYDAEIENILLRSFGISEILVDDIQENYFNYKEQLIKNNIFPRYPSISIPTMQKIKKFI